jgi:prophage DNA circulation protein
MAWRDELRKASFRGVSFNVDSAALNVGRRLARHEYPQRDVPSFEDMGRKAREYKVDAYILGPDYMAGRDALLDAVEQAGAGQLVHPYHGTLQVTVSECDLSESTQHGGLVNFTITFIEAGRQQEPKSEDDTQTYLLRAIDASDDAYAADFTDKFNVGGLPEYVSTDASANIDNLLAMPGMSLGNLAWVRSDPTSVLNALLPENRLAALADPLSLARGVLNLLHNVIDITSLLSYSLPASGTSSIPGRLALNSNRAAFANLVLAAAVTRQIGDLAQGGAQTVDDARIARAQIVSLSDSVLLNDATGQRTADSIVQVRTESVAHFAVVTPTLPRLVSITPQAVRPAVVAVHDFYGDDWFAAGREDELIVRNHIRHPGFVPAGYPLQVVA